MQLPDLHRIKEIPPQWWGAIAGVAVAGAVLVPEHKLLAGAAGAAAMTWLALRMMKPCCSACTGAGATPTTTAAKLAPDAVDGLAGFENFYNASDGPGAMGDEKLVLYGKGGVCS